MLEREATVHSPQKTNICLIMEYDATLSARVIYKCSNQALLVTK